jgi:predicted RNA-binding protein YlqC (UPF0109 family)
MNNLIQLIVQLLVDRPDEVRVNEIVGGQITVLELAVAKSDLGKVIGKQGKIAEALRTILKAASSKTRRRMILEIIE